MRYLIWIALFLLAALSLPTSSVALPSVLTGTLTCRITTPDAAFHFGSARPMTCELRQKRFPRRQIYRGMLKKYGIEWGVFDRTEMRWTVYSNEGRIRRGGLAGSYGGYTLEAAVGQGIGANVLQGGSDDVLLSPIGVQTQSGSVNITTGVMRFRLRFVR
jgi:hypothetical protein